MKISQISYSQSKETMYGIGLKRWDKCAVEIQIEENDNPENAFQMAKQLVNEQIEKSIAMDDECRGTKVVDIVETKVDAIQATLDEIEKCKTPDELKTLWLISKSNLTLSGAYKLKEKSFNDAK